MFFKRWGRPLKVGYIVGRCGGEGEIDDIATSVARNGHQAVILLKKGLEWPVRLDHFDIRRVDISPALFGLVSLVRILKRKTKKKIDVLLTDDAGLGALLKMTRPLHGAHVIIKPSRESVLALLKELKGVSEYGK